MTEQNNSSTPLNILEEKFEALKDAWGEARENNDGMGVDTIVRELEELAKQGHDESFCLLGYIFQQRNDNKRDEVLALEYIEQAIQRKFPDAFLAMGLAYDKTDKEKAFQFYRSGAELGDVECMNLTGLYLIAGIGTDRDGLTGIRWTKKAADAGHLRAQLSFSRELIDGDLISVDLPKAIQLLEQLYKNEDESDLHAEVAWQLHRAYTKQGDAAGKKKAEEWFRLAAVLGHKQAMNQVANTKRNDQWSALQNLSLATLIGKQNVSFFYNYGKVTNKRTETQSHTSGGGTNGNVIIKTTHTSWQVIELRDHDGNQFEVTPDKDLVISNGTEVDVVYICKGGTNTGYPLLMIDRNSGKIYPVKSMNSSLKSLGAVQVAILRFAFILGLICGLPISLVISLEGLSIGYVIICLGSAYLSVKALLAIIKNNSLWAAHIQKITDFLLQK